MSAPSGWYADAAGERRWWDGQRWIDAQANTPVAPVASTNTLWVWLIVLLPLITMLPLVGYMMELTQGMAGLISVIPLDGSRPDPVQILAAEVGLIFTPWYLILTAIGWAVYGVCVWFSAKDAGELSARGIASPFPWAWSFLSPVVYVIGRHVVIRRRGGRGSGPLIATITIQVVSVIAGMVIGVAMVMGMMAEMFDRFPEI